MLMRASTASGTGKLRKALIRVVREPLLQFLLLGFLIWGGIDLWHADRSRYTIYLGPQARARLTEGYIQQFGKPPTPERFQQLIAAYLHDEIAFREGLALHLNAGDEIIRRRIVQKYEFLQTDLAAPEPPTAEALARWFEHNKLKYQVPVRVAFTHVYFSAQPERASVVERRALAALEALRATKNTRAPQLGDVFPGPADVSSVTPDEAARVFGESEFATKLFELPVGQWSGPYRSGYGWHLVYVVNRVPAAVPPLQEIHDAVLADYMDEQRRIINDRAFEKVLSGYTIRADDPAS